MSEEASLWLFWATACSSSWLQLGSAFEGWKRLSWWVLRYFSQFVCCKIYSWALSFQSRDEFLEGKNSLLMWTSLFVKEFCFDLVNFAWVKKVFFAHEDLDQVLACIFPSLFGHKIFINYGGDFFTFLIHNWRALTLFLFMVQYRTV